MGGGKIRLKGEWIGGAGKYGAGVDRIAGYLGKYEFAESGVGWDFLVTEPVRNMAKKFRDSLPCLVSLGAKGSGKTFCHLQICRFQKWDSFLEKVLGADGLHTPDAFIYPLAQSIRILKTTRRNKSLSKRLLNSRIEYRRYGTPQSALLYSRGETILDTRSAKICLGLRRFTNHNLNKFVARPPGISGADTECQIAALAGMIRSVSPRRQVILATQSPCLVDEFQADGS